MASKSAASAPQVTPETISVYYHVAQLAAVLELLRVESPVSVYEVGGVAGLTTSTAEPVGEEEGDAG